MNFEQQLKQAAEPWLAEETLSPERAEALAALVRNRSRRPRFRWGTVAAAVAAVVLLVAAPVVTGVASDLPVIGPYLARWALFDRGATWANEEGYITPVAEQVTANGYTFRVEGVLADAARTQVFWVIEGPNLDGATPDFRAVTGLQKGFAGVVRSEMIDGRLVGSTSFPALQEEKASVTLRLAEVAGVQGPWEVSFEVSRAAMDPLARTVAVAKTVAGNGYDLTVTELVFAPTETLVRVDGGGTAELEIMSAKLLADGKAVQGHVFRGYAEGTGHWDLNFDRLEGQPANLALRIDELGRVEDGGPVLDLSVPGATAQAEGMDFTLRSVTVANGRTTVTVDVAGADRHLIRRFRDWVLTDASGWNWEPESWEAPPGESEMTFTYSQEIDSPVKLEARKTVKTVARDLTVPLPIK